LPENSDRNVKRTQDSHHILSDFFKCDKYHFRGSDFIPQELDGFNEQSVGMMNPLIEVLLYFFFLIGYAERTMNGLVKNSGRTL
jgi:hypothetical protein